jgi:uncharacterized BrkB/YihY/UPF0761 family membrane protein
VNRLIGGRRSSIYGTLTSVLATLLGFVLAVAAIVLSYVGAERFTLLRESKHYPQLWQTFTSAIRVLCLATVVSVVSLILERKPPQDMGILMALCVFTSVWAALRVARTVWALESIIQISTRPINRHTTSTGHE